MKPTILTAIIFWAVAYAAPANALTLFHNWFLCSYPDCADEQEGYDWAKDNDKFYVSQCNAEAKDLDFWEGCYVFVAEHADSRPSHGTGEDELEPDFEE